MRLPHRLDGNIIYATSGSGKTYIANKYNGVVDVDDVLVTTAQEISPGFIPEEGVDPRKNIFNYHRYIHFSASLRKRLYAVTECKMQRYARD